MGIKEQIAALPDGQQLALFAHIAQELGIDPVLLTDDFKTLSDSHTRLLDAIKAVRPVVYADGAELAELMAAIEEAEGL